MAEEAARLVCEVVGERDGATVALARLGNARACLAVGVRVSPDGTVLWEMRGSFPPEAVDMSPGALLPEMRAVPATRGFLACLGVLGGSPLRIIEEAVIREEPAGRTAWKETFGEGPSGLGPGIRVARDEAVRPFSEAVDIKVRPQPTAAGTRPIQGGSVVLDGPTCDRPLANLAHAWAAAMDGFVRARLPFLDGRHWSPEVQAFYLEPAVPGSYRRQAGALYPILAPLLPGMPEVRADIDAGRPFEAALAACLTRRADEGPPLTAAALRRMRGLTDEFPLPCLGKALAIAARFPVDRLPATPQDWRWLFERQQALAVYDWGREHGLADLVTSLSTRRQEGPAYHPFDVASVNDMAARCAETLVGPALGWARGHNRAEARRLAAAVLFGGSGFPRARDASNRWHADLVTFDRRLPAGRDAVEWPALFEPFAQGGLAAVCLTRPSQLRAEGWVGPDKDGIDGLAHCVGGYGTRCWEGRCAVVSVRAPRPDGSFERVSTAEISGLRSSGGLRYFVEQHLALANAEPPAAAYDFVHEIACGLQDGRIPVDPGAFARRDPGAYDDGVDWQAPASVAASLEAWRPHLPRAMRALDADAFRNALGRIAEGVGVAA